MQFCASYQCARQTKDHGCRRDVIRRQLIRGMTCSTPRFFARLAHVVFTCRASAVWRTRSRSICLAARIARSPSAFENAGTRAFPSSEQRIALCSSERFSFSARAFACCSTVSFAPSTYSALPQYFAMLRFTPLPLTDLVKHETDGFFCLVGGYLAPL